MDANWSLKPKPVLPKCNNCERIIGKMETPRVWQQQTVCAECYARLEAAAKPTPVVVERPRYDPVETPRTNQTESSTYSSRVYMALAVLSVIAGAGYCFAYSRYVDGVVNDINEETRSETVIQNSRLKVEETLNQTLKEIRLRTRKTQIDIESVGADPYTKARNELRKRELDLDAAGGKPIK